MNRRIFLVLGIAVIVLGVVVSSAAFTVHQTTQAIVMQLGNPKRVVTEPGLHWKLPFIQDVLYYDKRMLNLDPPVESILLSDQKRLRVAAFARYRTTAALLSFPRLKTETAHGPPPWPLLDAPLPRVLCTPRPHALRQPQVRRTDRAGQAPTSGRQRLPHADHIRRQRQGRLAHRGRLRRQRRPRHRGQPAPGT